MVELLATVSIVGILLGAAVPMLSKIGTQRPRAAARVVRKDLATARELAVATGRRVWLRFTASSASYTMWNEVWGSPGAASATQAIDPGTGAEFNRRLGVDDFAGVAMTVNFDSTANIGFDWLGQPLNANESSLSATGVVTLTGTSGSATVNVTPVTGVVTQP